MKRNFVLLILLMGMSLNSYALFYTGNDLHEKLNSTSEVTRAYARGYIIGVADMAESRRETCAPAGTNGISVGQLADLVKKLLAENPQHRHHRGDHIVAVLMELTWPCPE